MGTFIIRPTSIVSGGTPLYDENALPFNPAGWFRDPPDTVLELLQPTVDTRVFGYIVSADNVSSNFGTDTIRCGVSGASIYLDGSMSPITFAALPVGFTPLSASVKVGIPGIGNPPNTIVQYFLQQGAGVNGTVNTNDFPIDFSIPPSMLDILAEAFGLKCTITVTAISTAGSVGDNPSAPFNAHINDLRIEGTYELGGFSWTLEQPTRGVEDTPVAKTNTDDTITITSPPEDDDPDTLDLEQVTEITIEYTDENGDPQSIIVTNITIQNHNKLVFKLPDILSIDPNDPPKVYKILITSTQFSGSVLLGKLVTIYFFNAPGIYRLVPDKATDTLYDIENGGTVEVQIPDPFIKTGFVGN